MVHLMVRLDAQLIEKKLERARSGLGKSNQQDQHKKNLGMDWLIG
jgi:hypothetical protein